MGAVANKKNTIGTSVQIFNVQPMKDNPMFSIGKVKTHYTGINRNNSNISMEATIDALPTLAGTPIIGEYLPETDNFGGHGGKVIIEDGKVNHVDTTSAYGFVSENSNFYWEKTVEKDGSIRDYLVADKAIFWTGRYPQLKTLLEEGTYNQSMEIEVSDGDFEEIDGQTVFNIKKFIFTGLCILGVAKGEKFEGHVEPCFESASISMYELKEQNSLKEQLKEMMYNLQFSKNDNPEGGKSVTNFTQLELSEKLDTNLASHTFTKEDKNLQKYKYVDHTIEKVIFEDLEEKQIYSAQYTVENDELTVNFESKEKTELTFTPKVNKEVTALTEQVTKLETEKAEFESSVSELTEKLKTANSLSTESAIKVSDYETMVKDFEVQIGDLTKREEAQKSIAETQATELRELREFKRNTEIDAVKAKFADKVEAPVLEKILEDNSTASVAELESLVFMEIGKQNFSLNNEGSQQKDINLFHEEQKPKGQFSAMIEQYKAITKQ